MKFALDEHEANPVRFWAKVDNGDSDACWNWTGALWHNGYGRFHLDARRGRLAHRVAYALTYGCVPRGLVLDHLCRNKRCVNPEHLEAVTVRENTLRGRATETWKKGQAMGVASIRARSARVCIRGHIRTPENTYLNPDTGYRACKICIRLNQQRQRRTVVS